MHVTRLLVALGATLIFITACGENRGTGSAQQHDKTGDGASNGNAINVYLATGAGALSPAAAAAQPLVYVPTTL